MYAVRLLDHQTPVYVDIGKRLYKLHCKKEELITNGEIMYFIPTKSQGTIVI